MNETESSNAGTAQSAVRSHDWLEAELRRLTDFLHERGMHPDFEYKTTTGPRKNFDNDPPSGEGWERNLPMGRDGWERFDYHEEGYWRRLKASNGRSEPLPPARKD